MKLALLSAAILLAGCAGPEGPAPARPGDPAPGAPAIALRPSLEGLAQPILVTHAGDGSGRLFVAEQGGLVKVVRDGAVLDAPFLDLRAKVRAGGEQGLLGLAFHPRFEENGIAIVSYTDRDGTSILERYHVPPGGDAADPESATETMRVEQPYANHNGGHIAFGPDGMLYFGLGDGGGAGDPQDNGQDPRALLGSLLRIDADEHPYAIPPDNPFADGARGAPEVWAKGLRNPWRFTFDRETGDLYLGDVGQNAWEEIDFLPAGAPGGANFGWDAYEGAHRYELGATTFSEATNPIAEYAHGDGSCSVVAGHVYRGEEQPALAGRFFFADHCTGVVYGLERVEGAWRTTKLLDTDARISSFGEDEAGEVYVVDHAGRILRLVEA